MTVQPNPRPTPEPRTRPLEPTGTAALLVNDDGQYLLHLRDAHKPIWASGLWALPGGGREPDESLQVCIERELREEAGLHIADLRPFAIIDDPATDGPVQVYAGTWNGDPAALSVTEGIMLRWTKAAQMRWLTMEPGTASVIERHRAAGLNTDPGEPLQTIRIPQARDSVRSGVGAHLYLEREGAVLLGKRHASCAYAPGWWHALAVH